VVGKDQISQIELIGYLKKVFPENESKEKENTWERFKSDNGQAYAISGTHWQYMEQSELDEDDQIKMIKDGTDFSDFDDEESDKLNNETFIEYLNGSKIIDGKEQALPSKFRSLQCFVFSNPFKMKTVKNTNAPSDGEFDSSSSYEEKELDVGSIIKIKNTNGKYQVFKVLPAEPLIYEFLMSQEDYVNKVDESEIHRSTHKLYDRFQKARKAEKETLESIKPLIDVNTEDISYKSVKKFQDTISQLNKLLNEPKAFISKRFEEIILTGKTAKLSDRDLTEQRSKFKQFVCSVNKFVEFMDEYKELHEDQQSVLNCTAPQGSFGAMFSPEESLAFFEKNKLCCERSEDRLKMKTTNMSVNTRNQHKIESRNLIAKQTVSFFD
jgi:hypothetical protein